MVWEEKRQADGHETMIYRRIAWQEFAAAWRGGKLWPLLSLFGLLSVLSLLIPVRLQDPSVLGRQALVATQLLLGCSVVATIVIHGLGRHHFYWSHRRIGTLPARNTGITAAVMLGHIRTWISAWAILVAWQALCFMVWSLFYQTPQSASAFYGSFLIASTLVMLQGTILVGWGVLLACLMPTIPATLALGTILVSSHFLLTMTSTGKGSWLWFSTGFEVLAPTLERAFSWSSLAWALLLTLASLSTCNLLATWALEVIRGQLSVLEQDSKRS